MDKKAIVKAEKEQQKVFKKSVGKCSICGKPVAKSVLKSGKVDVINGAVVGDYIAVYGHPTCIHNVDHIVVQPNRLRVR